MDFPSYTMEIHDKIEISQNKSQKAKRLDSKRKIKQKAPESASPPPFSKIFLNFSKAGTRLHFYKKMRNAHSALTFLIGGRCLRKRRMMGRRRRKKIAAEPPPL